MTTKHTQKTVTAVIIGAPNAGKSTLLNRLCGQKVSIVSPKPQTTRSNAAGIITKGDTQVVFLDTPGIFNARSRFEANMVEAAKAEIEPADVILFIVDASRIKHLQEYKIMQLFRGSQRSVFLVLNKIDQVKKSRLLEMATEFQTRSHFSSIFMISAASGDGLQELEAAVFNEAKPGAWLYPEDQTTNVTERTLAEEITREKFFHLLQQELPYGLAVRTEKWAVENGKIIIHHLVLVEREAHKKIAVGDHGSVIKQAGTLARKELTHLLGHPVELRLFVKTDPKWKDKPFFHTT